MSIEHTIKSEYLKAFDAKFVAAYEYKALMLLTFKRTEVFWTHLTPAGVKAANIGIALKHYDVVDTHHRGQRVAALTLTHLGKDVLSERHELWAAELEHAVSMGDLPDAVVYPAEATHG